MEPNETEICNCSALRQAARHASRLYDEVLLPVELTISQYSMLAKLDRFGDQAMQDLAARMVMDRSTLGHLLRPLEARGLVAWTPSETDRRRRIVVLTAAGRDLLTRARPLWVEAQRRFETGLGADASKGLRSLMAEVVRKDFA